MLIHNPTSLIDNREKLKVLTEGLLIEFGGIHGSGKTTMIEITERYLESNGVNTFKTGVPTDEMKNKQLFKKSTETRINNNEESYEILFQIVGDISSLYNNTLIAYLMKDYTVLCRRYTFSSIAETTIHIKNDEILNMLRHIYQCIPIPDLSICLDVSPEIAEKRIKQKMLEGKIYKESVFNDLKSETLTYQKMAEEMEVPIINSDGPPEETFEYIKPLIDKLLEERKNRVKRIEEPKSEAPEDTHRKEMIEMLQRMAHDIKRPFTILNSTMSLIGRSDNPETIKWITEGCLPEVKNSINSVNSILDDLLELGRSRDEMKILTDPAGLVNSALKETFLTNRKGGITFNYEFTHTYPVHIAPGKVSRIFVNIIENAIQAMKGDGVIWFKTKNTEWNNRVAFCIGNSGSYIPEEKAERIFDIFYTSGKAAGTGVGLAVSKKIVRDYGCDIWCKSSKEKMETEFYFTLPAMKHELPMFEEKFPVNSDELLVSYNDKINMMKK